MKKNYYQMLSSILILMLMFFQIYSVKVFAQCTPVDHGGADLIISANNTLGGEHTNIRKFQVVYGVTLHVNPVCKFLIIHADTIIVNGVINGNFAGEAGGAGGVGGVWTNGSGNPGQGGQGGNAGFGPGGGIQGSAGGIGGFVTQICGGLFCSGNRDGFNGGGGGGGAGSGAAYGGAGGIGGWGAFGSGFTGAPGGNYGVAGIATIPFGTEDDIDITWGSGGGGAGGGGGGWNYGTAGGAGGKGGGMVTLKANGPLTLTGSILCDGSEGGVGGNGGGESTNGTFTCSSTGYDECSVFCGQSIFDASGGAGGGGGGGSGGGILLQANGPMIVTGNLSAKGGHGGTAGYPRSTSGACFDNSRGGGSGGGGRIKIFSNPCFNHNISPTISVDPGSNGAGNVVGIQGNPGSYRNNLVNPDYTPLVAGSIDLVDPEFCFYGDVPLISSSAPATGGMPGMLNYQWQFSITGPTSGFSNIPGQTSVTFNPTLISQTTWYRRRAVSGICEEFSNVVLATVIDCTTIDENEIPVLKLYPNPATNQVFVQLPETTKQISSLQIINLLGQTVYGKSAKILPDDKVLQLNLNLPSGNYIVRIITDINILNALLTVQ